MGEYIKRNTFNNSEVWLFFYEALLVPKVMPSLHLTLKYFDLYVIWRCSVARRNMHTQLFSIYSCVMFYVFYCTLHHGGSAYSEKYKGVVKSPMHIPCGPVSFIYKSKDSTSWIWLTLKIQAPISLMIALNVSEINTLKTSHLKKMFLEFFRSEGPFRTTYK